MYELTGQKDHHPQAKVECIWINILWHKLANSAACGENIDGTEVCLTFQEKKKKKKLLKKKKKKKQGSDREQGMH